MTKKAEEINNLKEALAKIEKDYGKGAIMEGDVIVTGVEPMPTGAITLDAALGIGGVPRGRIIEIFGPEGSGKTTLCLEIIANAQRAGKKVAFIDVEHALDPTYAQNGIGVNIGHGDNKLLLSQPDSGEEALTICELLAKSGEVALIVIDSVAALVPQAELDGEMGDANPGAQGRLMSKALRRLKGVFKKTNTGVIFTNQIREKVGVFFGSPEVQPGGRALKFYSSVRMDIRRTEAIKSKGEDSPVGNRVRVKIVKNKVATPHKEAYFDIIYGKGINKISSITEMAENLGLIEKKGSIFKYDGNNFNGRTKMIEFFEANEEILAALNGDIIEKLKLKPVTKVNEELEAPEDTIVVEK